MGPNPRFRRWSPTFNLIGLIRRQELAFRALELFCQVAPLRADAEECLDRMHSLQPSLTYMQHHMVEQLRVEDLAAQVALSLSRFHAVFKAAFGYSPMAYAHRQRVAAAWRLLMSNDLPLRAIAARTGFCNEFHMSRAFKAVYGHSPAIYRRIIYANGPHMARPNGGQGNTS